MPDEQVVLDVGDLPCRRRVGVCEGVSNGEAFCCRYLEHFFSAEVALSRLLVGLGAGEGEQDEKEGDEGGTHGGEGSAEGVIL